MSVSLLNEHIILQVRKIGKQYKRLLRFAQYLQILQIGVQRKRYPFVVQWYRKGKMFHSYCQSLNKVKLRELVSNL